MRSDVCGMFWDETPPPKPPPKQKVKRTPPPALWESDDYLPYLAEALAFDVPYMSDNDLMQAYANKETLAMDIECYPNYVQVAFMSVQTEMVIDFEMDDELTTFDHAKLLWILENFRIVTFNGIHYDMVILALVLAGYENALLKEASDLLIMTDLRSYQVLRKYGVEAPECDHIDIKEVAPLTGSLKAYAGRLHSRRMQDLPFNPHKRLSNEQRAITRLYCVKDLTNTMELFLKLEEPIKLREQLTEQYGVDVRSKSDAQIAEAVITEEIKRVSHKKRIQRPYIAPGTTYNYQDPYFLKFQSDNMQWVFNKVLNTSFIVSESGNIGMPRELADLVIPIGNSNYRMGIGGLHSSEKSTAHYSNEDEQLEDIDVESYYPRIILNQRLYPSHLGPNFLKVYNGIVERRLRAKHSGDKATSNSLKIVINGSFGKLGSKYSNLYSPDLLIQVTLTGQLSLLLLIERFELAGIPVVSANTDGIVVKCATDKQTLKEEIVKQWEKDTCFKMESNQYKALYSRDVNNYLAVKLDNSVKAKGAFGKPGLSKNPQNTICNEAVSQYLKDGTPVATTIHACTDVNKFVTVRNVKGGAVFCRKVEYSNNMARDKVKTLLKENGWVEHHGLWVREEWKKPDFDYGALAVDSELAFGAGIYQYEDYLGKVIRWYYSRNETGVSEIVYAGSGNKVPRSEGAFPMMDKPDDLPNDIDYDWYIEECYSILKAIGQESEVA